MKAIHSLLVLILALPACTGDVNSDAGQEEAAAESPADGPDVSNVPPSEISFSCQEPADDSYGPQSKLYINIGSERYFLDEVRGCNDFVEREDYSEYNIPESAVAATYAQWSGYGMFFYVLKEGDELQLFFTQRNAIKGGDMVYEQIGTFGDGELTLKEGWQS